jgi:hypothetical protein
LADRFGWDAPRRTAELSDVRACLEEVLFLVIHSESKVVSVSPRVVGAITLFDAHVHVYEAPMSQIC